MRLAKRFNIPSKELRLYSKRDSDKIIIVARKPFINEDLSFLKVFVNKHKRNIEGVVIHDDKLFGDEYGKMSHFFLERGIKVLRIWDKIVSDEEIKNLEDELSGATK